MPKHDIKGLTLHRPWDWAILNAGKDIENREWPCYLKFGDYIALHAGNTYDHAGYEFIADMCAEVLAPWPPTDEQHRPGFIYGVAQFDGNVTKSDSPWFFGTYGWKLKNVVIIEPVACRGAPKLFTLPVPVLKAVRTAYKAAIEQPAIDESIIADSEPLRPEIDRSMIYADIDAMDEAYADVGPVWAEDWGAL